MAGPGSGLARQSRAAAEGQTMSKALHVSARLLSALTMAFATSGALGADVLKGADLYQRHCAMCHGADGRPTMPGAVDFAMQPQRLLKPDLALMSSVRNGIGAMPAFQGVLRDRDILDIIAHLRTLTIIR